MIMEEPMPNKIDKIEHRRIRREKHTIDAMLGIYCRGHHKHHGIGGELCPDCAELRGYAHMRLDRCRYHEKKPTCGNCPAHCYKPSMKDRVMQVMRYSGPRMTLRHPYYALMHLFDGFKKAPEKPASRTKQTTG